MRSSGEYPEHAGHSAGPMHEKSDGRIWPQQHFFLMHLVSPPRSRVKLGGSSDALSGTLEAALKAMPMRKRHGASH